MAVTKPFTSERNFTPTSVDLVSDTEATTGAAELGQIVHGQAG
jgi:hypothetical protein